MRHPLQAFSILFFICRLIHPVNAQSTANYNLKGIVLNKETEEAIPFANIALYHTEDSLLVGGTVSSLNGEFNFITSNSGNHGLRISAIGYESMDTLIHLGNENILNLGKIYLRESNTELEEVIVVSERTKAEEGVDKTVFFVNQKMVGASYTGIDILKFIPGVQLDFMQNISLQGSSDIIILVNGMERDSKFVHQLNAQKIDRVEIMNSPPAKYEGAKGGVINVILKDDRKTGFDGNVYLDLPTSRSQIYVFPTYNLNYGTGKINLYTSYDGDFKYFDIEERYQRRSQLNSEISEINSTQYVRQKNWSHRFHFGLDYFINEKAQLNLYANYNPYSREYNGYTKLTAKEGPETMEWIRDKKDNDMNHGSFYSLYYKRIMGSRTDHNLAVDASFYRMRGANSIVFYDEYSQEELSNRMNPAQNSLSVRTDYSLPLSERTKLALGIQNKFQLLNDQEVDYFEYSSSSHAAYLSFHYNGVKIEVLPGLRIEKTLLNLITDELQQEFLIFLPNLSLIYKLEQGKNLKLNYRRSVYYPGFYALNPYVIREDPFSEHSGNPMLKPMMISNFGLEYSWPIKDSWISTRFFHQLQSDIINEMSWIKGENKMETTAFNLGKVHHLGAQISGSFSLGKIISLQAYFKGFVVHTYGNEQAQNQNIENKIKFAYESGLSAIASLKYNITLSGQFMYNSPIPEIQWLRYRGDPLYTASLEKAFAKGIKAGIYSIVPFSKTFTYRGANWESQFSQHHSTGNILLSMVPFGFKFRYQFSSGYKRERINREKENLQMESKKGF